MKKTLLLAALLLGACASNGPEIPDEDSQPLKAVGYLDLDRYMGRWYLIANIPYFAEMGNVAPWVQYSKRDDGMIDDVYTAQDAFDKPPFSKNALIDVTDPMTHAEGRITVFGPLWQDYAVVYMDKEYRNSVVAHPSRNYAWIFSREQRMADEDFRAALAALKANGFDVGRVQKIPQKPEDIGAPGFQ